MGPSPVWLSRMFFEFSRLGHSPLKFKAVLMGLGANSLWKISVALHLGSLGLVGVQWVQQRNLEHQLSNLAFEIKTHCEPIKGDSSGTDPDPIPSSVGNPTVVPKTPEDRQWYPRGRVWWDSDCGLWFPFVLLLVALGTLLVLGQVWSRSFATTAVEIGSPVCQRQLAQRQLAEIRLRRHGFGQ